MSQSIPSTPEQPESAVAAEPAGEESAELADDVEAPLNRAARRAKLKQGDPSHVGPRGTNVRQGKGPRSNSKRPR